MTTINENKPVPVSITVTIATTVKANPSIADMQAVIAGANELAKLATELVATRHGEVDGYVLIGKQKFKLAD
jgi:hypothetical protein